MGSKNDLITNVAKENKNNDSQDIRRSQRNKNIPDKFKGGD